MKTLVGPGLLPCLGWACGPRRFMKTQSCHAGAPAFEKVGPSGRRPQPREFFASNSSGVQPSGVFNGAAPVSLPAYVHGLVPRPWANAETNLGAADRVRATCIAH